MSQGFIHTSESITATNGLTKTAGNITLGGALSTNTTISGSYTLSFTNTSVSIATGIFSTQTTFNFATASTVPYFDASKNLISSAVTPTELGLLSGITGFTGSGTLIAKGTSPVFTTDITTPKIIGVSGITLQDGASSIKIGTASSQIGLSFTGSLSLSDFALWGTGTNTVVNTPQTLTFRVGNATQATINSTSWTIAPSSASTSGATTSFTFTGSANTGQTASTEINRLLLTTSSRQWNTGAITTQREVYITSPTYSFVGASTITSAYTLYVAKPTTSTNATITNNYGIGTDGKIQAVGYDMNAYGYIMMKSGVGIISNQFSSNGGFSIASQTLSLPVGILVGGTDGVEVFRASGQTTSGATNQFIFSGSSATGQTASTEISGVLFNSYSRQWSTGPITTQREQYIRTVTYTAVGASVITSAYAMYIEAATASTNITITNNYALGLSGSLQLQTTTTSTTGVIYKGTTRFLHNFNPTGSSGRNLFLGDGAGNFTATWSSGADSTANTGLGNIALQNLTTGSYNNCIGARSGQLITNGNYNNLQGYYTGGELVSGGANVAIGESSLRFGDGSYNVGIGYRALFGTTANSYSNNVAIGAATGYNLTTGSNNIFIGYSSTTGGITSGAQNILIGYQISPQSVTANGQLSIGNLIFGQGISATGTTVSTGTVGIGIVASTTAVLSLAAGTTTKAPVKFTSGTNLTVAEAGAMEYDGSNLYFTNSTPTRILLTQSFPMGETYMTGNATATTIASSGVYYKVSGTTTLSHAHEFTAGGTDNRLTYTGTITKMFHVACTLSVKSAGSNDIIYARIAKNGTTIPAGTVQQKLGSIGDVASTAIHVVVELATNDYIELFVMNNSGTSSLTITDMNMFGMGIYH